MLDAIISALGLAWPDNKTTQVSKRLFFFNLVKKSKGYLILANKYDMLLELYTKRHISRILSLKSIELKEFFIYKFGLNILIIEISPPLFLFYFYHDISSFSEGVHCGGAGTP